MSKVDPIERATQKKVVELFENELIVTEGFNSLTLNLSNLSNAVYYVSIFNDIEQVLNKKIILNEK